MSRKKLSINSLEAINCHSLSGQKHIGAAKLPHVSIIITNYNYAEFLGECIESCLAQDYEFCEVLLVDDCSKDSSKDVYSKYAQKIKIVEHSSNKGQLAAFFTGLEAASGEFIVFVDADDFLDADAVSAHLYLHLFELPQVGFTCLRNRQVSAGSATISDFHTDFANNSKEIAYIAPRVIHTPTWSWSTTSAMMFRADLLRLLITDKTDDFRVCADYYLIHFANLLGGSLLFDRAKANYRRHGKNNFSKNFVIGGEKRPTGHDKYHAHPAQISLQKAILDKLVLDRASFEPYFGSISRYAETILYVAEKEFVLSNYTVEDDLKKAIISAWCDVKAQKRRLIWSKKIALWLAKWQIFFKTIGEIRSNYLKVFAR